ncbi:transposase [Candidatus Sarmatiella mevalonica]|uniref:transposase n=1 Tax=Candidatus Sarmatiella mevalonica TaxID=2770581 RepID=UPI0019213CAD|nr:transposase [Candidatus Sarmatiella mevalonica]
MEGICTEYTQKDHRDLRAYNPRVAILVTRWVVERTFAWLSNCRRLSEDYKIAVAIAENVIMIAHSMLLLKILDGMAKL